MLLWDSWGVSSRPFMYRASCCESRMGVRSQRPRQESQARVPLPDSSLERDFDCLSLKPVEQGRAQWHEHLPGSKETRFHNNCLRFLGTNSEPSSKPFACMNSILTPYEVGGFITPALQIRTLRLRVIKLACNGAKFKPVD